MDRPEIEANTSDVVDTAADRMSADETTELSDLSRDESADGTADHLPSSPILETVGDRSSVGVLDGEPISSNGAAALTLDDLPATSEEQPGRADLVTENEPMRSPGSFDAATSAARLDSADVGASATARSSASDETRSPGVSGDVAGHPEVSRETDLRVASAADGAGADQRDTDQRDTDQRDTERRGAERADAEREGVDSTDASLSTGRAGRPADGGDHASTVTVEASPAVTEAEADDEHRRSALIESLPAVTEDTPLMAELRQDARRRIELRGRRFPRPAHTRVVTVANQKGGVGKTTTAVNLAAALAQSGLHVLVLDNDPQGNASTALGIEHAAGTPSIYEVLVEGAPMQEAVQESPDVPNLLCLPATIELSGAEIELVSMVARETRLRGALDDYLRWRDEQGLERIDYVFVDCPPSLGLLTVNAFVVGREVLIPIQCEYYALEGLSQLLKTIQLIQAHLNPDLHVSTILLTMYDARTNLAQQVARDVREHFPGPTLRTTVPRSVRISEAPSYGQTVVTYDPGSTGALAYLEAARELAERGAAPDGGVPSDDAEQSESTAPSDVTPSPKAERSQREIESSATAGLSNGTDSSMDVEPSAPDVDPLVGVGARHPDSSHDRQEEQ